jgi:hypothetical protein
MRGHGLFSNRWCVTIYNCFKTNSSYLFLIFAFKGASNEKIGVELFQSHGRALLITRSLAFISRRVYNSTRGKIGGKSWSFDRRSASLLMRQTSASMQANPTRHACSTTIHLPRHRPPPASAVYCRGHPQRRVWIVISMALPVR